MTSTTSDHSGGATAPTAPAAVSVYCPFPLRESPFDVAGIDEEAVAWCLRHGLCEPDSTPTRMGCADGIAPALPHAPESTVLVATQWFYLGALLDDFWDRVPELDRAVIHAGELNRVMFTAAEAEPTVADPWVASAHDLRRQLAEVMNDAEFVYFRAEYAAWLNGQLWYSALQQRPTPIDPGQWVRLRSAKSGVGTLVPFTAATIGYPLSTDVLEEPRVRAFVESTMMACVVVNDLFSAAKERRAGTAKTNLITILTGSGLDSSSALVETWQLYERIVILSKALQHSLLHDPRPEVARLAAHLPNWISAGLHWAATTTRYDDNSAAAAAKVPQLVLSDVPVLWDAGDLTPAPYPEIAWWWQYAPASGTPTDM